MKNNKKVLKICKLIGCSGFNKDCWKGNINCDIIQKLIKSKNND